MGLALAVKRGEIPKKEVSEEVKRVAESISEEDIKEFAKTNEKNLPEKVSKKKKTETRVSKEVI